jgi:hypothetical protein
MTRNRFAFFLALLLLASSALAGGLQNVITGSNGWQDRLSEESKAWAEARADVEIFRLKCLLLDDEHAQLVRQVEAVRKTLLNAPRGPRCWKS